MKTFLRIAYTHVIVILLALLLPSLNLAQERAPEKEEASDSSGKIEEKFLSGTRQLTFEGRRAGEGYFSSDGSELVFQSERDPKNPFFQIFLMDMETGDVDQISPGQGKTTCAWIHPEKKAVLFASTHEDPDALKEQQTELDLRASGKQKRYSWDYDEFYEIYAYDRASEKYTNLTNTRGYDAEGSYSPNGNLIAFASNRNAYSRRMTAEEEKNFKIDPAYMMDIFIMNSDGTNVRQLTKTHGYDGGPFFSPDGKRICWRRFAENGATAEIMTMNIDGSDQRRITNLQAMSWAPYYHPSGEYLIFTTNRHGFNNFELYIVDVEGKGKPIRVTDTLGFDGLPVFTPDGARLTWTTNRTPKKQSQLFMANWNHAHALKMLKDSQSEEATVGSAIPKARENREYNRAGIEPADLARHVEYFCSPELNGRMTGSPGEKLATEYVATLFDDFGFKPIGDNGTYFQKFEFTSGVSLGDDNVLKLANSGDKTKEKTSKTYTVGNDWLPLSFSKNGTVEPAPVVFAGYGIVAPEADGQEEYDSFVHIDVKDKWVVVFRFMPEGITPERRQHLARFSSLRFKAMVARDKGARGLIFVSGPTSKVNKQLIDLRFDGSLSGTSIPIISVTDDLADNWLKSNDKSLLDLQKKLDTGDPMMGFEVKNVSLSATIDIEQVKKQGRNVLGYLQVSQSPSEEVIIFGAHIDHLGKGQNSSSLARDDEKDQIHYGADDNASGVAGMLEVAEYLSDRLKSGKWKPRRDIIFAAWSGEELGLIGSSHFVRKITEQTGTNPHATKNPHSTVPEKPANPHANPHAGIHAKPNHGIVACFNMDMIGRLSEKVVLQGIGSSSIWKSEIERRNVPVGLPITLQDDSYIPTDASVFFMNGVPILSAFTGSHSDYHTPRDTPNKLDYSGAARISKLMALITGSVAEREKAPDYIQQTRKENERRANLRAYLGTIPDYSQGDVKGVLLSGVTKGAPAEKAGIKNGDVIVKLAGKKIENIYDYTYAIEALKIDNEVEIVVQRKGKDVKLKITPGSRD